MGVCYREIMTSPPDTLQKMAACIFPGLVEGHPSFRQENERDEPWRWLLTIPFGRTKPLEIDESVPFTTRTFVDNCMKTGYFQAN